MSISLAKPGNTLAVTLLISACCIGAGMIGLPVVSAFAGFIPATLAMALCYIFATSTGLLILEATLWFDREVNLLSLANFALGKTGKAITYTTFLFLFYCLFIAYIDGSGQLVTKMLSAVFAHQMPREVGVLCSVAFVGTMAYFGTRSVSRVSRIFLCGVIASYLALVCFGLPHIKMDNLMHANASGVLKAIPIMLVCFGYQNLIPTLTYYVKKDPNAMRTAILIGNLIPFTIYSLWNFVILGMVPESAITGQYGVNHSSMVTSLLEKVSGMDSILLFANAFAFFAILSPFMANTLSFFDFLKDGFKMDRERKYDLVIYGLILGPPMLLTLSHPDLFLQALSLAGGLADVILFGILPVVIVWVGRYIKKVEGPYTVSGGKALLVFLLLLSVGFILIKN